MYIVSHKTQFPFYRFIKQAKPIRGDRYKLTRSRLETKIATSVLERVLRAMFVNSNVLPTHGNQYKLIHLLLEAKTATIVLECILRTMFVNSTVLQPRSRLRVKLQGVFALTFMANIQRTAYSRPCSLYTFHQQFFQWSCYISFLVSPKRLSSFPRR